MFIKTDHLLMVALVGFGLFSPSQGAAENRCLAAYQAQVSVWEVEYNTEKAQRDTELASLQKQFDVRKNLKKNRRGMQLLTLSEAEKTSINLQCQDRSLGTPIPIWGCYDKKIKEEIERRKEANMARAIKNAEEDAQTPYILDQLTEKMGKLRAEGEAAFLRVNSYQNVLWMLQELDEKRAVGDQTPVLLGFADLFGKEVRSKTPPSPTCIGKVVSELSVAGRICPDRLFSVQEVAAEIAKIYRTTPKRFLCKEAPAKVSISNESESSAQGTSVGM